MFVPLACSAVFRPASLRTRSHSATYLDKDRPTPRGTTERSTSTFMRVPPNDPTPSSGRRRAVRQSPLRPYSQTVFAVAKSRSQSGRGGNCGARWRAQTSGVAIVRVPCPAGDKALNLPRLIRAGSPGAARPPGSGGPGLPRSETSTRGCSVKRLGFSNLESPSGQNARLPGGIEKETEGMTLVSTRHSAPQFPLHPYIAGDPQRHCQGGERFPVPGIEGSTLRSFGPCLIRNLPSTVSQIQPE